MLALCTVRFQLVNIVVVVCAILLLYLFSVVNIAPDSVADLFVGQTSSTSLFCQAVINVFVDCLCLAEKSQFKFFVLCLII